MAPLMFFSQIMNLAPHNPMNFAWVEILGLRVANVENGGVFARHRLSSLHVSWW